MSAETTEAPDVTVRQQIAELAQNFTAAVDKIAAEQDDTDVQEAIQGFSSDFGSSVRDLDSTLEELEEAEEDENGDEDPEEATSST